MVEQQTSLGCQEFESCQGVLELHPPVLLWGWGQFGVTPICVQGIFWGGMSMQH